MEIDCLGKAILIAEPACLIFNPLDLAVDALGEGIGDAVRQDR